MFMLIFIQQIGTLGWRILINLVKLLVGVITDKDLCAENVAYGCFTQRISKTVAYVF